MRRVIAPIFVVVLAFVACGDEGTEPGGKNVAIEIAPLSLPAIDDACYALEVENDLGQTVWFQPHLCSNQYGDGIGSLSFVGPCDAVDNDSSGDAVNTITLTLKNIYTGPSDTVPAFDYSINEVLGEDWDNPCGAYTTGSASGAAAVQDTDPTLTTYGEDDIPPYDTPCQLTFDCLENTDVLVTFNLTIMRDANQGFFDIAVNFEDIFCSAKFDTCYEVTSQTVPVVYPFPGPVHFSYKGTNGEQYWVYWNDISVYWVAYDDAGGGPGSEAGFIPLPPGPTPPSTLTGDLHQDGDVDVLTLETTATTTGDPIELLHDADGIRRHTGILGVACTGGPTGQADSDLTDLYMNDLVIECRDVASQALLYSETLDPAKGPGNVYTPTSTPVLEDPTVDPWRVWQFAVYEGEEVIECPPPFACDKVYWNVAIGLAGIDYPNCNLTTTVTASDGPFAGATGGPWTSPANTAHPFIAVNVQITSATNGQPNPAVLCSENPLNGTGSGVTTQYTPLTTTGMSFSNQLDQPVTGGVVTTVPP